MHGMLKATVAIQPDRRIFVFDLCINILHFLLLQVQLKNYIFYFDCKLNEYHDRSLCIRIFSIGLTVPESTTRRASR